MHTHLLYSARQALVAALLIMSIGIASFFAFEPVVGQAITSNITVSQTITAEISFAVSSTTVGMQGTIAGITGGYATGTNVTAVNTNNATGYNMTLFFSSTTAMKLSGASSTLSNYPATSTPDFAWIDPTTGTAARFGYTVRASTTGEVAAAFMNNGAACGVGSTETNDRCWQGPSTSTAPRTIINSTAANVSSTSTIKFKVAVPNAPSPILPTGVYVATGTLTATTNP